MRSDPISAGLHAGRETTASQRAYLLFLLLSANILNYADRGLPSILLPSIRRDLVLSDTQLALIIGFAFSLFYSIVGIPLGRLSDRFRRSTLLSICIALWSVMTAVTGLAGSFFHLAIGRFGVGIGEAGLAPSSHSLISDFYPPRGRTTALAIVALGIPLGSLTAYLVGGGLNHLFGWRMAFFVMAIPGLILALLIGFTLRELPRGRADGLVDTGKVPSFVSVVKILWHIPSYRHCLLGTAFSGMTYGAVVHWAPSFLSRSYGMQTLDIGSWLAPLVGIGGGAGTLLGGYLVDRLRERDIRWGAWLPAVALGLAVVPAFLAYLVPLREASIALLFLPMILIPSHLAPFAAVVQGVSSLRMRGTVSAISHLISALIGSGVGPLLIGLLSDGFRPSQGEESLRYALMILVPIAALCASIQFAMASRTLAKDLAAARERA